MALNKDNNFLQSDIWRKFQEAVGCRTFFVEKEGFSASIIEHKLPIVGKYLYAPRGPVFKIDAKSEFDSDSESNSERLGMTSVINLAKKENAGWVRVDPENNQALELIKNNASLPIKKAPHDMQPKEILVMDISKTEEELLDNMKSKTRYNIKLAEKKGVVVKIISNDKFPMTNQIQNPNDKDKEYYIDKFIELVNLTAERKGIEFHPENYYRKMIEIIPEEILKLYVAEYKNKIIAANLMIFFGDTATYLHGATDDEYRNVMAPYLLQWQAIKDAKEVGCLRYDFGGVKSISPHPAFQATLSRWERGLGGEVNSWSGITKFKTGFAPTTEPVIFPGSYDIIIDRKKYYLYRIIQKMKCFLK